jgi:hypothetical protein
MQWQHWDFFTSLITPQLGSYCLPPYVVQLSQTLEVTHEPVGADRLMIKKNLVLRSRWNQSLMKLLLL